MIGEKYYLTIGQIDKRIKTEHIFFPHSISSCGTLLADGLPNDLQLIAIIAIIAIIALTDCYPKPGLRSQYPSCTKLVLPHIRDHL